MSLFASVSLITTTRGIFPNICGILYSHTPRHAHVHTFFTFWTKCRKTISLPPVQQSPFLRAQSAQNPVHDDSSPHPLLLQLVRLLVLPFKKPLHPAIHPSAAAAAAISSHSLPTPTKPYSVSISPSMAWRGPATRAVLAAVRRPAAAARLHAPRRRVPPAFATTSSPLPSAR
jgi:hypothetical protein